MKKIPLTQGRFALVDDDSYEKIMSFGQWGFHQNGYAIIQKGYKKNYYHTDHIQIFNNKGSRSTRSEN